MRSIPISTSSSVAASLPPPRSATASTARRDSASSRRRRRRGPFPSGRSSSSFTAPRARTSCGPMPTGGGWSEAFATAGYPVVLPWGSDDERARSERYAAGVAGAIVPPPPRLSLRSLASSARARRACRRRRHGARPSRGGAGHAHRVALRCDGPDALRRRSRGCVGARSRRHRHRPHTGGCRSARPAN